MKNMDLMKAMNELDDDILREAEAFEIRGRHRMLRRIAAVAAAAALLCGTVYAAVNRVRTEHTGQTYIIPNEAGKDVTYTQMEVVYEMGWHQASDETLEVLQQLLDEHWLWCRENTTWSVHGSSFVTYYSQDQYEQNQEEGWHDPGPGSGIFTFHSFEEAEEFLGLTLDLPPVVREGELSREIWLRVLTDPLGEDGYLLPDAVSPGCVELQFRLADPAADIAGISGTVIIPLTEAFAAEPYTETGGYALDLKGTPRIEGFTTNQLEGQLVYFLPVEGSEYDDLRNGSASAYYTCKGIGYSLHILPSDNRRSDDPKEILMPHLEQIG